MVFPLVQQAPAVVPVAYHLAAAARFDEFGQPAPEQFRLRRDSLYIVNPYALIQRRKSLKIRPCRRLGPEYGEYARHDYKFLIKIGADGEAALRHQAEATEPSAALLVQFGPSSCPRARTETLEGDVVDVLKCRINPAEAQCFLYGVEIPQPTVRGSLATLHSYPALLLGCAVLREPSAEVAPAGDVKYVYGSHTDGVSARKELAEALPVELIVHLDALGSVVAEQQKQLTGELEGCRAVGSHDAAVRHGLGVDVAAGVGVVATIICAPLLVDAE